MRTDSRLSRMLHVLLHMARQDAPFTSERIAQMLHTNPVVVRRTMAGLREAGYVRSEKGHGGGWTLAKPLAQITLRDVHEAVGSPRVFAFGVEDDAPTCAVAQAVNGALEEAMAEANALLLKRLASVTLAQLAADFDARCEAGGWPHVAAHHPEA